MLSTVKGRLVALSTPFGQLGWFFDAWESTEDWKRVKVTADRCPRIGSDFLREERKALGSRWFDMEYRCVFLALAGGLLDPEDVDAALAPDVPAIVLE